MSENKFKSLTSINTNDGSPTLEVKGLEETYHSRHGAVQESMHVFIENGLKRKAQNKNINILEVGLGTGLNLLLTYLYSLKNQSMSINYHALEKFPLDEALNSSLDFSESIKKYFPEIKKIFIQEAYHKIISSQWNAEVPINERFNFTKDPQALQKAELGEIDLVYYDAFGPRAQSEMWESDCFEKISAHVHPGGMLVTYCTQGKFRRILESLGWEVSKVPGPPGKREMVVAVKTT